MTETPGRLSSRIALVALALAAALPGQFADAQCVAGLNGDRIVDGADLGLLMSWWGGPERPDVLWCLGDSDRNDQIAGADLGALLARWGSCGN